VRVSYYDVKNSQITNSVPLSQSSLNFKDDNYSQPIAFPLIVKNIGMLSAKNIQLNVRYPGALIVHSSGEHIVDENDPFLRSIILVAHKKSNLQPGATVLIKDTLEVPRFFFEGISSETPITTKDNFNGTISWKVEFDLVVECLLFCDDSLPTYARIKLFNKDRT
jgi:hypothetical protein